MKGTAGIIFCHFQPRALSCKGPYGADAVQLAGHAELRNIFTQQYRIHMNHWDVLHQAAVHILYLVEDMHTPTLQKEKTLQYVWSMNYCKMKPSYCGA